MDGGKGSVKLDAQAANGATNAAAGKLFGKHADGAEVAEANKAAAAVNAVSGMQILKVIVEDAEKGNAGEAANTANNIVDAAIGNVTDNAVHAFSAGGMDKDDKIAAAIVLRGMAKDGKFAVKDGTEKDKTEGTLKSAVASATSKTLLALSGLVQQAVKTSGGHIGTVVDSNAAKKADAGNVKEIAKGIKAIVDAAVGDGKGSVKLDAQAASGANNADAGKLFGKKTGGGAEVEGANKAAAAVNAVSGMQILKVIVEDAEKGTAGEAANTANNIVDAAIGDVADAVHAFGDDMNKDDKIAAAIVLRGMAKDGKFAVKDGEKGTGKDGGGENIGTVVEAAAKKADAENVKEIAKGIKAIVDAAVDGGKGSVKLDAQAASGTDNADAGKLFGKNADGAEVADANKAAAAVNAVSGMQILKVIVDDAEKGTNGAKADAANNIVDAAIGNVDAANAVAFGGDMNKDDKIAAAIVLRGMAKDGKFAVKNTEKGKTEGTLKSAVASATSKTLLALSGLVQQAVKTSGGHIGTVVEAAAKKADAENVKAIAKGIKAIVDAAVGDGKGSVKLDAQAASGTDNKDAGKLFGKKTGGGAEVAEANKAAAAVNAVSGMQILKVIVEDAEKGNNGAKADTANNIVDAAIGDVTANAVGFGGNMDKDDKIAAAIVLRGMAKDGKFAVKDGNEKNKTEGTLKSAVASATSKTLLALSGLVQQAVKTGGENIGTVVEANDAVKADAENVKEIAKGIKAIVDAAVGDGKGSVKLDAQAASGTTNAAAGKLFGKNNASGAEVAEANKAAAAVNAVSGMQILKVIVDDADKGTAGAKADTADNIVDAAIGDDAGNAVHAFGADGMDKDDKIAAAIVLRGMAKDGKFAVKDGTEKGTGKAGDNIGTVVNADDAVKADAENVKEIAKGIKAIVDAAVGDGKGSVKLDAQTASGATNADAGKLFGKHAVNGAEVAEANKAAAAVNAVSGMQILKVIVDDADKGTAGAKADTAENIVDAAIGNDDDNAVAFGADMNKDDKIAAAIVLRGMAKNGKFAVKSDEKGKTEGTLKSAVASATLIIIFISKDNLTFLIISLSLMSHISKTFTNLYFEKLLCSISFFNFHKNP